MKLSLVVLAAAVLAVEATTCRKDPTWKNIDASCKLQTDWNPRSRLTQGKLDPVHRRAMTECVEEQMKLHLQGPKGSSQQKLRQQDVPEVEYTIDEPQVVNVYPNRDQPLAVEISFALSEYEAAAVLATATCVRKYHSDTHFEDRKFKYGGNKCTFMAGYLQDLVPGVCAQVVNLARLAWKEAGWQLPEPGSLGLRTEEHLLYSQGGEVGIHTDSESVYTVLVALTNEEEYGGGEFLLFDPEGPKLANHVKVHRLSTIVFLSSVAEHAVSPVTFGSREMLAMELWEEDDVPHQDLRPSRSAFRKSYFNEDVPDPDDEEEYGEEADL